MESVAQWRAKTSGTPVTSTTSSGGLQPVSAWKKSVTPQKPTGIDFSAINVKQPKFSLGKFLKDTGKEIIKLPIRASLNVGTAVDAARGIFGNKEAGQRAIDIQDKGIESPTFGNLRPIGMTGKGAVADLKDMFGAGFEAASYIPIARLPALGAQALKTSIGTGAKQFAKEGAVAGGLGGAGHEMQNPESTLKSIATQGAIGTAAGTVLGGALGGITGAVGRTLGKRALSVSEWKAAGKPVESTAAPEITPQPKKTMEEYSRSQGYEPTTPTEKLPVIQMGEKPKPTASNLPTIELPTGKANDFYPSGNKAYDDFANKAFADYVEKQTPKMKVPKITQKNTDDVRFVPEPTPKAVTKTPEVSPIQIKQVAQETPAQPAKPVQTKVDKQMQSRVFERLKAENPAIEGDLGYSPIKLKEDAERAVNLIAKDRQKAFNVAMGKEASNDVTSTAVNIAMAEKALNEGNIPLYTRLIKNRSLEQTRRGQEIVAEKGSVTDNSTSRYVKELIAMRLDKLGNKYLADIKDIGKKTGTKQRGTNRIEKFPCIGHS